MCDAAATFAGDLCAIHLHANPSHEHLICEELSETPIRKYIIINKQLGWLSGLSYIRCKQSLAKQEYVECTTITVVFSSVNYPLSLHDRDSVL